MNCRAPFSIVRGCKKKEIAAGCVSLLVHFESFKFLTSVRGWVWFKSGFWWTCNLVNLYITAVRLKGKPGVSRTQIFKDKEDIVSLFSYYNLGNGLMWLLQVWLLVDSNIYIYIPISMGRVLSPSCSQNAFTHDLSSSVKLEPIAVARFVPFI